MSIYAQTFQRMRQLAGNPVLVCIKPRAQWTSTPSGYTYDADYDLFINGDGDTWKPADSGDLNANDYQSVAFLPGAGNAELSLMASGLVDLGSRFGRVLPADLATVQAAQWLEIDGYTYDLGEASAFPAGAAQWYTLRLSKR